jgi:16S rRNA (cytosine1402-N4)-methyltransferase
MEHYSVLLKESIKILNIKANGVYVDCTLGRAGHTKAILQQLTTGKIVAFDQDIAAITKVKQELNDDRIVYVHDNFKNLKANLIINGLKTVDGIFYDLGVSSPQFDEQDRGFSYRFDAELDMRMDQTNNALTAKKVVNDFSEQALAEILFKYGDEKFAWSIVKNIVKARQKQAINTTFQLVDIIKASLPQKVLKQKKHPAKKTFQALRIFINDELNAIRESLEQAITMLNDGGILAVITFHSLEERVVKEFFKKYTKVVTDPVKDKLPVMHEKVTTGFTLLTKKGIEPSDDEIGENRRSHSAKLWALRKEVKHENI